MIKLCIRLLSVILILVVGAILLGSTLPATLPISYTRVDSQEITYWVDPRTHIAMNLTRLTERLIGPYWSPDNRWLVYNQHHPDDATSLTVFNYRGEFVNSFLIQHDHQVLAYRTYWSPESNRFILAENVRDGTTIAHIYNTTNTVYRREALPRYGGTFQWTPDNERFSYTFNSLASQSEGDLGRGVLVFEPDTLFIPDLRQFTWLDETSAKWSSDGSYFAFEGGFDQNIDRFLYIMASNGELTALPRGSSIDIRFIWEPNGTRLAYDNDNNEITLYDVATENVEIIQTEAGTNANPIAWLHDGNGIFLNWVVEAEQPGAKQHLALYRNGNITELASFNGMAYNVRWSPDQSMALFEVRNRGQIDVYLFHNNEQSVRPLTEQGVSNTNPRWSPDGKQILFESDRAGFNGVYIMDADGTNVRLISPVGWNMCCAEWRTLPAN